MRKLTMSKKGSGTAKAAAKVVACMLSIMLVVTGIVPGFAAESKAAKQGGKKPAASKVISKGTDKKKAESKPKVSKDKGGVKKNKIKNKRDQVLELNESGNIRAKRNPISGDIFVKATNRWGDMNIDRGKWINMVKAFGGTYDPEKGLLDWDEVDMDLAGNISFETYGICLPSDCSYFFNRFSGQIENCAYLDTSKVRDMFCMFAGASNKSLDISSWDVSKVCSMDQMFARSAIGRLDLSRWELGVLENEDMFVDCNYLEYLKTPVGLETDIGGPDHDFKIVRFWKGHPVMVEEESQNLKFPFHIDGNVHAEGGQDYFTACHIYRKDKYAGVTFNKNGGKRDAWVNHEIVEKGKAFQEGGGKLPKEMPKKNDHVFLGWAKSAKSTEADFGTAEAINEDMTVYAVYKLDTPKLIMKVKAKKIKRGRKKVRVLSFRFRPAKEASGYVAKVVISGKVRKIKLKKGRKKLRGFIVGKITLPLKGKVEFHFRGFKKVKGKRHYGRMLYEKIDWFGTQIIPPASSKDI